VLQQVVDEAAWLLEHQPSDGIPDEEEERVRREKVEEANDGE
jgi:hypothetical protein